jgi:hypothetical protein
VELALSGGLIAHFDRLWPFLTTFSDFFRALPATAGLVLEKADMLFFHGVTQKQPPKKEKACPRAYCIMRSAWLATVK